MKKFVSILFVCLFCQTVFAQDSTAKIHDVQQKGFQNIDTIPYHQFDFGFKGGIVSLYINIYPKRKWLIGSISAAGYGGSLILLNKAWYSQYPKTSFHTFNDFKEWKQMDKLGHAWTVYNSSRATTAAWKWAGLSDKNAVLAGSASGFAFLTVIELLDAHSANWGWSWPDMGANFLGSALFASQQIAWGEQRIQYKYSAHKANYNGELLTRADNLFGSSLPERLLKDYNAQTYWLSLNAKGFLKSSNLPVWLNIAVGIGADGMYGGFENKSTDKDGNVVFNRPDIKRFRQFYLSPDIDLTKIKTNSKALRTTLAILNAVKIPAPTLMYGNGKFTASLFYF